MIHNEDRLATPPAIAQPAALSPAAQCAALFASPLQGSEPVTAETVAAEIGRAMRRHGTDGCTSALAQEFGDHPEEARDRMQWARRLVGQLPGIPSCAA